MVGALPLWMIRCSCLLALSQVVFAIHGCKQLRVGDAGGIGRHCVRRFFSPGSQKEQCGSLSILVWGAPVVVSVSYRVMSFCHGCLRSWMVKLGAVSRPAMGAVKN